MFEKIKGIFMTILDYFKTQSVEEVTGVNTNISPIMYQKINFWNALMRGQAPWNKDAPSCGIPQQISKLLNFFVSREIGITIENESIKNVMEHINNNVDAIIEYMVSVGGALIRPIYANNKLQYECLPLGRYLPTQYDFDGTLTGAIILKHIQSKGRQYILTEEHNYRNKTHFVALQLYKVEGNAGGVLHKVPLTACPETAELTPEYYWENVPRPMIIEFRNHAVNTIEDGCQVPISFFNGCEHIIKEADEHWARMEWEQESGERRVFADRELFRPIKIRCENGKVSEKKPAMDAKLKKLFVELDGDGVGENGKIHEFSPQLRTADQVAYLQEIFKRIEQTLMVGKGSISDLESVQQTATQYNGGRQALYSIVDYIEDEIGVKYQVCADVFSYMAAAYGLGANNPTIVIVWNDDKTRKDITAAKTQALNEIAQGVLNKWEYRVKFYGEDEETAKAKVPTLDIAPDFFAGA